MLGVLWQLPLIVGPWIFGRAIDAGIVGEDPGAVAAGAGALFVVTLIGAVFGILAAHARRPQLADQPLRHHDGRHPQGRADGPRAAAPLAHRRDPERRVQRLRRVRRDDRDHRPGRLAAGLLPRGGRDRDGDLPSARHRGAGRRADPGRGGAAVPASAPPPPGARALPQLRADLDGDRHRGRAAHPARDRRRAHLRPQLRPAVAELPGRRRLGRHLAGRHRGARRALLRRLPRAAAVARHPRGARRPALHRPADQLPRLRPLPHRPDPDVLRVRAEDHPVDGQRPQGDRDLRARAAVARPARARRARRRRVPHRRPDGPDAAARRADGGGQRRPGGVRPAGRPAGPLPPRRHRAGQRGARGGAQGPSGPRRPVRARPEARRDRRPRRRARAWPVGGPARRRRPRRRLARRRTLHDPGERHREPALRRDPAGRRRPAPAAHPPAGRGGAAGRQRRGRVRRPARRLAGRARRAWPRPVGRSASARGAGPRPGRRRPDPGPGRAHLGRRRPHRGADRGAGHPPALRPYDGRVHRLAALAPPRRPGGRCWPTTGSSPTVTTTTCWPTTRPTARSWPGRWTRRWRRDLRPARHLGRHLVGPRQRRSRRRPAAPAPGRRASCRAARGLADATPPPARGGRPRLRVVAAVPSGAGRSPATARSSASPGRSSPSAAVPSWPSWCSTRLAAATGARRPEAAGQPRRPHRRRQRRWSRPGRAAGRGRGDHAGALHLPRPADLDALRAGPARVRTGVHRPHHPAAAARPGGERQHRRPRHAGDPRRRHHEPGGAVRPADGDHLAADRRAVRGRDAAQLRAAGGAVPAGDQHQLLRDPQLPARVPPAATSPRGRRTPGSTRR